jgi:hypothetical protein
MAPTLEVGSAQRWSIPVQELWISCYIDEDVGPGEGRGVACDTSPILDMA